jgi:Fe-S-cluster containining protein
MITKQTQEKEIIKIAQCDKECQACQHACQYGSGALAKQDIKELSKHLKITEKELIETYLEPFEKFNTKTYRPKLKRKNKPYGQCIFFKDGCTVHKAKPLECKTATCKPIGEQTNVWFNVNHMLNTNDKKSIEQFKIYLTCGGKTIKGAELKDLK